MTNGTERDSVISAANVLMVALLKMNRVIIPVLLKYNRARRLRWIQQTERDLLRQDARLCSKCATTHASRGIWRLLPFGHLDAASVHAAHVAVHALPAVNGGDGVSNAAVTERMEKTRDEKSSGDEDDRERDGVEDHQPSTSEDVLDEPRMSAKISPVMASVPAPPLTSVGATFHQRVAAEEARRRTYVAPFVYTSVVRTTFTIASIWIYALTIIATVLSLFPFGRAQSIIFSFSLLSTATISEAETLLSKSKSRAMQQQVQVWSPAAKDGSVPPVQAAARPVVRVVDEADDFSDGD